MKTKPEVALKVLRRFFKIGYDKTNPQERHYDNQIQGLFVSDCCVLWTVESDSNKVILISLILKAIRDINKAVLDDPLMKREKIMLKTSVAYGEFEYIETQCHQLIQKELIFGDAYIRAFDDNSARLDPGLCRLVVDEKFPDAIKSIINGNENKGEFLRLVKKKGNKFYFFWNCDTSEDIDRFWTEFHNSKKVMYEKMYEALSQRTMI
jgi:hypothetical protein